MSVINIILFTKGLNYRTIFLKRPSTSALLYEMRVEQELRLSHYDHTRHYNFTSARFQCWNKFASSRIPGTVEN